MRSLGSVTDEEIILSYHTEVIKSKYRQIDQSWVKELSLFLKKKHVGALNWNQITVNLMSTQNLLVFFSKIIIGPYMSLVLSLGVFDQVRYKPGCTATEDG